MENMTCKRRLESFKSLEQNKDTWEPRGKDLCCSYCNSMHPDKVLEIAKDIISGKDKISMLHMSDKYYKMYVDQKGVSNAMEGGIKFYTFHIPEIDSEEWLKIINEALKICSNKFKDRFFPNS